MREMTWPAIGLIAVLGAVTIGLAALTDWGPGEILGLIGILAGIGGGAAVAGGVSKSVDQLQETATRQSSTLNTVARRVNGDLDKRIEDGVTRALQSQRSQDIEPGGEFRR